MKIHRKTFKLTREEKMIERAVVRGEYVPASREHISMIAQSIARYRKDAVLNLRINRGVLDGLKRNAKRYGIPYQKFVCEILHRYAA